MLKNTLSGFNQTTRTATCGSKKAPRVRRQLAKLAKLSQKKL